MATQMESCLIHVAERGHHQLLEALKPQSAGRGGRIDLPALYHAWRRNDLRGLRQRLNDPRLRKAVADYKEQVTYGPTERGLRHLIRLAIMPNGPCLAGKGARLSWLHEPANIDKLTSAMIAEDYKENTVQISLWTAISKLLQQHLSKHEVKKIMGEARRPKADDRRDVVLSAHDLHRVISASEWEVRMFLLLKASTGIDKSPLLRIRRRDVDFKERTLYVRDTKTKKRRATIDLPSVAILCLQLLLKGKRGDKKAFDLTKGQIDYRWRKARKRAGLTREDGFESGVRLKDLRHTFAAHYVKAGGNIAGLMDRLRHEREHQSLMYARYESKGTEDMDSTADAMGLTVPRKLEDELLSPEETEASKEHEMPTWWFKRSEPGRLRKESGTVRRFGETKQYTERGAAGWADDPEAYYHRYRQQNRFKDE